jgi:hypothetical protein
VSLYAKPPSEKYDLTRRQSKLAGALHTVFDSDISLRYELKELLAGRGHKVIFRKVTDRICPNYDPSLREEHDSNCPYCMGTKHMYQDYMVLARYRMAVDVEAQARERRQEIGYTGQGKFVYYLEAIFKSPHTGVSDLLKPTRADYILEIELDDDGRPIRAIRTKRMLNIQFVQELRDNNGRIEFYAVHCAERTTGA